MRVSEGMVHQATVSMGATEEVELLQLGDRERKGEMSTRKTRGGHLTMAPSLIMQRLRI